MLTHKTIWQAIDRLAEKSGFSASGLARRAGLDPTSFNKSKRISAQGKPRWPTTESLARALRAAGLSFADFVALVEGESLNTLRVPVIGMAQAGRGGYFDDAGHPTGHGWDEIQFPDIADPASYALEIAGDSMLPVFRDGDLIVVSPSAPVRRGDRVVARTQEGEVMVKLLARRTAKLVALHSFNPEFPPRVIETGALAWMSRIIWASQ
jgi:phage repressor protein C with HTH and peptisase S24 domain